jgi:hypothetical protein
MRTAPPGLSSIDLCLMSLASRAKRVRSADLLLLGLGLALLALILTRYLFPFRLDDVLFMEWARTHAFWDAWHPVRGEVLRSVRPVLEAWMWILTRAVGTSSYLPWHLSLVGSFFIALGYAGLTARYLSNRASALQFTSILFFVAFAPILNVLFWFSDMTYTLELMFVTAAWYYGIRGFLEKRWSFWIVANILGALAVMTKEPAIVLIHTVWIGVAWAERRQIIACWKTSSKSEKTQAIVAFVFFLIATLYIFFISPTGTNRFYTPSEPDLGRLISERASYYWSILRPGSVLLIAPVIYVAFSFPRFDLLWPKAGVSGSVIPHLVKLAFAVILAFRLTTSPTLALGVMTALLLFLAFVENPERTGARRMLPFVIAAWVVIGALLITITMVKTQLTELAVLLLVIAGWSWSKVYADIRSSISSPAAKWIGIGGLIIACATLIGFAPQLKKREALLRDVREARMNANEAVKWVAEHTEQHSTLVVMGYRLHGIDRPEDISAESDSAKIEKQYTFYEGFVFLFLSVLNRSDIQPVYLDDPLVATTVLDSLRTLPNTYLLLQTALDRERFYSDGLWRDSDSLISRIGQKYLCEIWKLSR